MVCAIALGVKGIKYAHKTYKKHQMEKEMSQRSIRPPIIDPSNELEVFSNRNRHDNYGNVHEDTYQTLPAHYESNQRMLHRQHRDSGSSVVSQTSTVEIEGQMEDDLDLQRFIEEQKRRYHALQRQSQQSSRRSSTAASSTPAELYSENVEPPTYDSAMAQHGSVDARPYPHNIAELDGSPV